MQIQTIEERTGLVFDPAHMLAPVELDGVLVPFPVRAIKIRVVQSGDEIAALITDHDAVILRLVHEVLALRARVVALEAKGAGAPTGVPAFEDALLALTRPEDNQ